MTRLLDAAESVLRFADARGVDEAEAYVISERYTSVALEDKIKSVSDTDGVGVGIRVVRARKVGFASVSSIEPAELKGAVQRAVDATKSLPVTAGWKGLVEPKGKPTASATYDSRIAKMQPAKIVETASSVIDAVQELDKRAMVSRGGLSYGVDETAIANTKGVSGTSRRTSVSFDVNVSAEESGKKGNAWEFDTQATLSKTDVLASARKAASAAVNMITAKSPPTGKTKVIFSDRVAAAVLQIMFAQTVTGESVHEGRSPWADKVGKVVAQEGFNLTDNGRLKDGVATRPLDEEGTPQTTTKIISERRFEGFLYDDFYGKSAGKASTGNARRSGGVVPKSFARPPKPGITNLVLEGGDSTLAEMIKETRDGIYVTSTIGEWLSSPISGQLDATISGGYLIRGGKIQRPIKGAVLHAEFFSMINGGIDMMGKEVHNSGSVYSGPIRAKDVAISGN